MTAPALRPPGGAYEGAGRQVAVALRGFSSVVVTSDDVTAAAHAAIGIALVFIPCLASAVTPRFLGGPNSPSFGMSLGQQFGETGTWALGSAMSVVLFFLSFLVISMMYCTIDLRRTGFTGMHSK